jgi:transposase
MLAAKGLSTREIAQITGWHHTTIVGDLRATRGEKSPKSGEKSPPADSTTTHADKDARAAEVAAAAEQDGVT